MEVIDVNKEVLREVESVVENLANYVLGCLHGHTGKVGNIRAYLLTSLYNAVLTIDNYYRAEANHDLYGAG